MICLLTHFTQNGVSRERGHMAWVDAAEAINYARLCRYDVEIQTCTVDCCVQQGIRAGQYDELVRAFPYITGPKDPFWEKDNDTQTAAKSVARPDGVADIGGVEN